MILINIIIMILNNLAQIIDIGVDFTTYVYIILKFTFL
jgi:hypothetical protein